MLRVVFTQLLADSQGSRPPVPVPQAAGLCAFNAIVASAACSRLNNLLASAVNRKMESNKFAGCQYLETDQFLTQYIFPLGLKG